MLGALLVATLTHEQHEASQGKQVDRLILSYASAVKIIIDAELLVNKQQFVQRAVSVAYCLSQKLTAVAISEDTRREVLDGHDVNDNGLNVVHVGVARVIVI